MSDIIFVGGKKKVKVKCGNLSLRDFYNRRNKVLVLRDAGGLGDILMMRMIFQDFKKVMPEAHISFAIPTNYQRAAFWHPHVDEVLNSKEVDENEFGISYNLTTACVRYEMKIRPRADRHRAEIWTAYCGLRLTNPDMHINVPTLVMKYGEKKLQEYIPRNKGYVCVAPQSNMVSKDFDEQQTRGVISGLKEMGYSPFILHNKAVPYAECPVLGAPLDQWLALINASDYVISVDTATFHASQGLGKPVVGVFSWADGKVYSKFHRKCVLVQRHRDHTPGWTCGPCYDHPRCPKTNDARKPCITEITVKEILDAFSRLINGDWDRTLPPSSETSGKNRTGDMGLIDTQNPDRRILELPTL